MGAGADLLNMMAAHESIRLVCSFKTRAEAKELLRNLRNVDNAPDWPLDMHIEEDQVTLQDIMKVYRLILWSFWIPWPLARRLLHPVVDRILPPPMDLT